MLFRKKIERSCQYCTYGIQTDPEHVVCAKKGLVPPGGACRRFQYDPLKRIPPRRRALDFSSYDQQDFSL